MLTQLRRHWKAVCIFLGVLCLAIVILMNVIAARPIPPFSPMLGAPDTDTLVVVVHGLNGAPSRDGMLTMVRAEFKDADVIAPLYFSSRVGVLSNADPYTQADTLEVAINRQFTTKPYAHVILFGHSMGGSLLRKSLVWANGEEEDRPARRGKRLWPQKVDRFVSLAGINRGWSTDPRPKNMSLWRAWSMAAGEVLLALTDTGHFIRELRRGAPFVADLRVQWMNVARNPSRGTLPPTIHLLGLLDDIVSGDDSRDLCVATGVKFVSLANTGHADIAAALRDPEHSPNAAVVRDALSGRLPASEYDATGNDCQQDLDKKRLVLIVHGIRDFAGWVESLKYSIEQDASAKHIPLLVELPRYGWFPMARFLLLPDRQRKVRWFMDKYTDAIAKYPNAESIDFIGHSNGTYLLGAALIRYKTIKIRNAYLAGSVLPQRFPWQEFMGRQMGSVRNVVASGDWVVAIFPRVFEQFAEWLGIDAVDGFLDVGAAGFRGFQNLAGGAVRNVEYAPGSHGFGVDIDQGDTRRPALIAFAVDGPDDGIIDKAFGGGQPPGTLLDLASRVSWLVWIVLIAIVGGIGWKLWCVRRWAGAIYTAFVILVLYSI